MLFFNTAKKINKKVDFLIIGAQKCGTSSLFTYLNEHPQFSSSKIKEILFFNFHAKYKLGEKWYHSQWEKFGKKDIYYYEATPGYWYYPFCPERIAQYNPKMKFICMVRDPIKRAYSSYNMLKQSTATKEKKEDLIRYHFTGRNPENENYFKKTFLNPVGFPTFESFVNDEMNIIKNKIPDQTEPSFYTTRIIFRTT